MIILPRRARDECVETSKKNAVYAYRAVGYGRVPQCTVHPKTRPGDVLIFCGFGSGHGVGASCPLPTRHCLCHSDWPVLLSTECSRQHACGAVRRGMLWRRVVWCGVWCGVAWCGVVCGGVASRRVACNATGVWGSDHERRLVIANYQSRNLSVARGRESSHLQMKGQRAAAL